MSSLNNADFLYTPPESFGIVEEGIYRCNHLSPSHFSFLQSFGFKTALLLSPEVPSKQVLLFFKEQGIELKHLGLFKETLQGTWSFISEEVVKESLQLLLNRDLQPVLVWSSGVQETGVVVGCLRKLQGWNLTSVIQEYRAFCGSKSRYVVEQFIELFDLDLIVLPRPQSKLPNWFTVD